MWALHLGVGIAAGALAVGIAALAAALISDGDWTLLTYRGLAAFIGVAVSIIVFSSLRTRVSQPRGRAAMVWIVAGAVVLMVAGALLYQPDRMADAQSALERRLGVWSSDDESAVAAYLSDIEEWNDAVETYRAAVADLLDAGEDPAVDEPTPAPTNGEAEAPRAPVEIFRDDAMQRERDLESLVVRMRSHAEDAGNDEVRDALDDLAGIYDDQLSGLKLVTRGLLSDDFNLLEEGDARFKASVTRARTLVDDRLREPFERHGIDADGFARAVEGSAG